MALLPTADPEEDHRRRLAAWRAAHPRSPHPGHSLEELEELARANDERLARDLARRPETCESSPSFVTIGNTHKCNLTCNMCFKQLDRVDNMSLPDLGLSTFEALAHELFPHLREVALSVSGDPLLSRTLFDELDLLSTYAVRAWVTTNGMPLARKGLFEHLLPALHTLVISMDGASRSVFDGIRRGASFPRVLENVRRFNEARDALPRAAPRPELHFNTILQHGNLLELPAIVELAHELGVERVKVDHVYVHEGLNDTDSLEPHKRLSNEMLERTRETAERLGVAVRLPAPFAIGPDHADEPFVPRTEEELLAHAREEPEVERFDPARHERHWEYPDWAVMDEVRTRGGSNAELVEGLLERGLLRGHLAWGVPQLGPSLAPADAHKPSACTYAWREVFVEWNGVVSPCCNPAMGAGRVVGRFEPGRPFAEIWNGETYRALRQSLTSGSCYRFCRTCYLFEDVDEAAWGSKETWIKVAAELEGDRPALAGAVPAGKRAVLAEVRSGSVPAGSRLEIYVDAELRLALEARGTDGACSFTSTIDERPVLASGQQVHVRCLGVERARVELVAFVE